MNLTPRNIVRLAVIGGLAASAGAVIPAAASAGGTIAAPCGINVSATANYTTLHGTSCSDTFNIGRYVGVTIHAGDGNDTVYAGFIGNSGMNYLYLGNGNDKVVNNHDKPVWVDGGAGNDVVQGSSGVDTFYGGPGTDTFSATPGDYYFDVENFS